MLRPAFLMLFGLTLCQGDETISGYSTEGATWVLDSINTADFAATASITFPQEGKVVGKAPCNTFVAEQTAPYPWFALKALSATRKMCAHMGPETTFFRALEEMTIVEVVGKTLILTNDSGDEMVFTAN